MSKTTKPVKTNDTTALAQFEEELAQAAQAAAALEKPQGYKAVKIASGNLMIDDDPLPGNEMDVIVLAAVHENQFFEGAYDADSHNGPVCYSFGEVGSKDPEKEMMPHNESLKKQHDTCDGCPHLDWGSAETGKGKACKQVRRLALTTVDSLDSVEDLENAEVRAFKVSVTNVKEWAKYVREKLVTLKRPAWAVITTIKLVPDRKTQFRIQFTMKQMIDDPAMFPKLKQMAAMAEEELRKPYPKPSEDEEEEEASKKTSKIRRK